MEHKYTFTAVGHPNVLATHKATLEITKDSGLTKNGDCIVAVGADFSLQRIKEVIGSCGNKGTAAPLSTLGNDCKIKLTIAVAGLKEEITAVANKNFSSEHEIVLRKGEFASERTLGIHADRAAADLNRRMVEKLRSGSTAVSVTIETHDA